jgi:transglutaminase-like putative cysteine protease
MLLNIEHRTYYTYSEAVNYTIQQLRLTPQDGFGQRVKRWDIRVNGHLHRFEDTYGNIAHTLVLDTPHDEISIIALGDVETGLDTPAVADNLPLDIYLRSTPLTEGGAQIQAFARQYAEQAAAEDVGWLEDMMHEIVRLVPYARGSTAVDTDAATAFRLGSGVCQDHAHIFIACCRNLGWPARYVSGYLFTADSSLMESHAWADIWVKQQGWQSFDVSNGRLTSDAHVRLAVGLDYRDACPVSGMRVGGGLETMGVSVRVNMTTPDQQAKIQEAQQAQQ